MNTEQNLNHDQLPEQPRIARAAVEQDPIWMHELITQLMAGHPELTKDMAREIVFLASPSMAIGDQSKLRMEAPQIPSTGATRARVASVSR